MMYKLNHRIDRRKLIKTTLFLTSTMLVRMTSTITHPAFAQTPMTRLAYGRGKFGQGTYPGFEGSALTRQVYLPLVGREGE